jgi:hypothetical protein
LKDKIREQVLNLKKEQQQKEHFRCHAVG